MHCEETTYQMFSTKYVLSGLSNMASVCEISGINGNFAQKNITAICLII